MLSAQCPVPAADHHLWRSAAERLRPRERVRPSVWAERNIRLGAAGNERPGPYRAGYLPWLFDMLDAVHDAPGKKGEIWLCPAQVGKTTAMIIKLLAEIDSDSGDVLYLLEADDKCREIASEKIAPMLSDADGGRLKRESERAKEERRSTMLHIPLGQSRLVVASSASESATTSGSYRVVVIDEFEMSSDALLKAKGGDIWASADNRVKRWKLKGRVSAFGHPRLHDKGLHLKWFELSDRGAWTFDCPHCAGPVSPRWRHVRYRQTREDGKPDPNTAWLCCPNCGEEITESQRRAAVWPAPGKPGGRPGGSGRRQSELSEEEAQTREFVGLWITALCDPNESVVGLARKKLDAEMSAERGDKPTAVVDFWNKTLGEPMQEIGRSDIPDEAFASCEIVTDSPSVPSDIEFITVGVDLGAPDDYPTLYLTTIGWGSRGTHYILDVRNIRGVSNWAEYHRYLQESRWQTVDGRTLGIMADCVDPNYKTGQAMDQARERLYSHAGGMIRRIVGRFEASMKSDQALRLAPEHKLYKPGYEHLGKLEYYYLHRHTWIDRLLRTFMDQRLKVALPPGRELVKNWRTHMSANVLAPVKDKTGWDTGRLEWQRVAHTAVDDWLTSATYALIAADAHGDLGRIHLRRAVRETARGNGQAAGIGYVVPSME